MSPVNYSWFLILLLEYSSSSPDNTGNAAPKLTPSYSRTGRSLQKVATATPDQKSKLKYFLHRGAVTMLGAANMYCRNTYDPQEVEALLDIDMDAHVLADNWWRRKTQDHVFQSKINDPICSHLPTATTLTAISAHEFFQRQINIPIQPGAMNLGFTKYKYIIKESAQKIMLICDCSIHLSSFQSDMLCRQGKIYFSRGTGGDKSFFVHVLNAEGSFHVIAHLCFH